MSGETGGGLTAQEWEVLRSHLATQWTGDPAIAVTIANATTPAVERILAARQADRDAALSEEIGGDECGNDDDLADRIESEAWIADRPGQMERLLQIAGEVRAALHPDPSPVRGGEVEGT